MAFLKRIYTFIPVVLLCAINSIAQDKPIGYWQSHLPYNTAVGLATDGSTLFTACGTAFFTYNPIQDIYTLTPYSKVEGMSDLGMQCVGYDASTKTVVLVYADGNIDLFKNNTFYNIPDLKIKSVAGSKTVNNVYTENGMAYLSTSLGILVIDLTNYNISQTYQLIKNNVVIPVNSFIGSGSYFYAATPNGLFRSSKSNPELQNFQTWENIDSTKLLINMANVNNTLFLSDINKIYTIVSDTLQSIYTSPITILHLDPAPNRLLVSEYNTIVFNGDVKVLDLNYHTVDSFGCGRPVQAVQLVDTNIWIADAFYGLTKEVYGQAPGYFSPSGPSNMNSFDIYAYNKNVWVAHGGYTGSFNADNWGYGMSNFTNDKWQTYQEFSYAPFWDTVKDLTSIVKNEKDGTVYTGSYLGGLFILKQNGAYSILKQSSIFDPSAAYGQNARQIMGLALDQSDNLWVTVAYAQHQLYVKTPDSNWYKFSIPGLSATNPSAGQVVIDANGQVWFVALGGAGVVVYNTNGTISDPSDDLSYVLTSGVGFGNLPSNSALCLAVDLNNNIWIGTSNGIGIVSNCTAPFTQSPPCDANIPIVQYDQFAGYLFSGNNVRAIAVDGANRKWVGTDNGVWLLSPDASQIVYRFTAENSPLPSNTIEKIAIDKVTGDVYIGTDHGLVTYHSTATEGGASNQNVSVFPDPVPSGYTGTIAIKGLVTNADVRITDITGQLVYRTIAFGGQATWNGLDYKGHRPQTGVYLVFVSSSDGSQTYQGKLMFMN